jgi:DNA polymerase-3 subunit delta
VADDLQPVYLISGSDRPKIDRALRRLRARFGNDATQRLTASSASGDDAVAACNALGLFAPEGRLVLVDEVERWKAADAKALAAYLQSPAPMTTLALVGDGITRDAALAKACAKAGELLLYDVQKRDLPKWVAQQFGSVGAEAEGDACRALVELVGDDPQELASEIEKAATWAAGRRITADDVAALVAARAEAPPFALTDAWGRRDTRGVLSAVESLLERSSGSREFPALVGRLAAHVRRVRACHALEEEGVRPRDAATKLKLHPFAAEKAFAQARNFTRHELDESLVELAGLDLALKGGSRLPPELALERALVAMTADRTRRDGAVHRNAARAAEHDVA